MKPKQNNPFLSVLHTRSTLMRLGSLLLTSSVASAATVYWDTNVGGAGSGNAGGNWAGFNWNSNSAGTGTTGLWANGDTAIFSAGTDGTGAWTVTLNDTISTPSLTFKDSSGNNSKTLSGSGTINIGGGTISSSAYGTANNGRDVNMNVILAGSGGLTIAAHGDNTTSGGGGGGSEFRLGAANTFSGGLTITSGVVSWSNEGNFGDPANIITLNGGGFLTTANQSTVREFKIGAGGGAFRNYGGITLTVNGPLSNVTGVASTTIRHTDGGTVRFNGSGTGFVGTVNCLGNSGAAVHLTNPNANWPGGDFVIGTGTSFTVNGTGTVVVKSINSTGGVNIDNGTTLNVNSGNITMATATGHNYGTANVPLGKLTSSGGTLTVTNGAASGNLGGTTHQIQVPIINSGVTPVALVKNNTNPLVLTQPNTYSGGTTINGGRLEATNTGTYGTGTVTVANNGQAFLTGSVPHTNTFNINGNGAAETAGVLGAIRFANTSTISGTVNVASAARVTAYEGNAIGILAGPLTGSAALEKTGDGIVSISGDASGYSGLLTVSKGILNIATTLPGNVAVADLAIIAGEGTIGGSLTLGTSAGADIAVDASTPGALTTTNLTTAGTSLVRLLGMPAVPGTPIPVVNYSGILSLPGTADDSFNLLNEGLYRGTPVFANTGTAITLTIPAGANLVWTGTDGTNPTFWNQAGTANWLNGVNPDVFYAGDNVLFDDTGTSKTVAMQGMLSPATVTFNNSIGNDYNITPDAGGFGFTGPTSIVKNGTGTATIRGYSHNYTGTVTINGGVLQGGGNYEVLGNASAVTVNNGGQLNINGLNLGNGSRHYSMTIAGTGDNGLGAITNSSGNSPNESAGIRYLTLSDNASIGGTGGRYDVGRSGGSFGGINGNGFTLTKVGSNNVCFRAPATNINYVVSAGTLKVEDSDTALGANTVVVNGGTLQAYGHRTFANAVDFAAGTNLDNDGGGNQQWNGNFHLTGLVGSFTSFDARNGAITLNNVISGDADLRVNAGNVLILAGTSSNTYTGATRITSTGQLILSKTGGAVAVPGDLYVSNTANRPIVSATADNQFGSSSVIRFNGTAESRFELKGTSQTVAGIDYPAATAGFKAIQHSEFGAPVAVDAISDLTINVADGNTFAYTGDLRDLGGRVNVIKTGLGTQSLLGNGIDYQGTTTVSQGRLVSNGDDIWTSTLSIASGAVFEANITSTSETYEHQFGGFTLNGTGTYFKSGPGNMTISWGNGTNNIAMASGGLIDIAEGVMRLEYGNNNNWTNNLADMHIAAGASINLWDNTTANGGPKVDALTGEGAVVRTNYAETGNFTVGVDNGSGDFAGSISNSTGKTHLIKNGTGTQTLSGANTYSGNTSINDGAITLSETGSLRFVIENATSNTVNGSGAFTANGAFLIETAGVTVNSGTWNLVNTSSLTAGFGATFSVVGAWTEAADVWTMEDGDKIWTFTEATGDLELVSTNSYATWIDGFFPGETNPAIIGATADPDKDGIANAVEMVIGGQPATGMNTNLLPTIELVTNPAGVPAGDYLLFTYRRTDLSEDAGLIAVSEYDADLVAPWSVAQDGISGVEVLVDDNYASFVPPAADTDRVRVFVPRAANQKLFGRLQVTVPAP